VHNHIHNVPRLRREQSFLGIHFDFHATEACREIGRNVTAKMIETVIKKVRPDYIQCDRKGHPGFSSYPTKVGYPAPGFVKDQLRIWREVTARYGVALYVHHSSVWDTNAIKHHPSWARIDENGKKDKNNISVFGQYVDKLLIPQLKELCDEYCIDGVWTDGDCWATCQDYNKKVLKLFKERTGIKSVPRKPEDPYFFEFTEFCRAGFRAYLNHYVSQLHKHNPDFQVCGNWAYSSFMPEPVTAEVDFLSGDYPLTNSVNAARMEARCLVHQGKPWDLMAWSFVSRWGEGNFSTKSVPQVQQEAAVVLSQGGGFQLYFTQKKDGSISQWQMDLMAKVAKFCRARQRFCHRAKPVSQIALLYSSKAFYKQNSRLFSTWDQHLVLPIRGVLQCLLDSQNAVDIVMEHHLDGRMKDYPLIVVPECLYLEKTFKKQLLDYVKSGGNLLLVGPSSAAMFQKELKIKLAGKAESKENWLKYGDWMCGLKTLSQNVRLGKGAKEFGRLYGENDYIGQSSSAASIAVYGKGRIAAVYVNLGERYCKARTVVSRDFLNALVRELYPKPLVEVKGSHYVDVSVSCLDGKLTVNLINTAGPHGDDDVYVFDEIPFVGPLHVTIRTGKKPKKLTLQPDNQKLHYTFSGGVIRTVIPQLTIHSIIMVE
jgi:hypothetical protein